METRKWIQETAVRASWDYVGFLRWGTPSQPKQLLLGQHGDAKEGETQSTGDVWVPAQQCFLSHRVPPPSICLNRRDLAAKKTMEKCKAMPSVWGCMGGELEKQYTALGRTQYLDHPDMHSWKQQELAKSKPSAFLLMQDAPEAAIHYGSGWVRCILEQDSRKSETTPAQQAWKLSHL